MLAATEYTYRPFLTPLPLWDYWIWLILPLLIGLSVGWKAMKCEDLSRLPREALRLTIKMIFGYALAGAIVWAIVILTENA